MLASEDAPREHLQGQLDLATLHGKVGSTHLAKQATKVYKTYATLCVALHDSPHNDGKVGRIYISAKHIMKDHKEFSCLDSLANTSPSP